MKNPNEYEVGETVYTLRVLGRDACCEAPSMLFARRGEEFTIHEIELNIPYTDKVWFVLKSRGGRTIYATSGDFTRMKHFESNYGDYQRYLDVELERRYSGWY